MLGLRERIAITSVASAATVGAVVIVLVGPGLRREATEQTRQVLLAEARLMARVVEQPLARGADSAELDPLIDEAAREVRTRVTIIATDGRVLADSALSGKELQDLENHAGRPEVREALASRTAALVRHSTTLGDDLLYAAVPVRAGDRVVGVARVALSTSGIEATASALRSAVLLALVMAFAITAFLSVALSSSMAGPLRQVMDAARQFAAGNLSARSPVARNDELGELARILNRSADQLQQRITEIARDRARTEAILASMEDGVLAVDHRGLVLLASDSLRRNLGLRDPEGHHYLEVIRQREVGQVLQQVLESGERSTAEVEIRHLRRVFSLSGAPFPGAEGMPAGAVLTFHDVTERRRVDRIRRDFVANASHELRTPLTSIRGFVEALEDGAMTDTQVAERFLGKIRVHADRMAALVQDLLELSRLESGERPPRWEPVQPAEVAEDVVASFAAPAAAKEIALVRDDRGAPTVVTDADRLRGILENLVDNAVKYTPAGGRVEVTTSPGEDGAARVEVKDNGPGIAAEHLPRIFERFYRVDKARSREMGGTGLGLSIVKHLAEGMGASVTVTSEVGLGTCFAIAVPARGEPESAG
jgi:two-component system, OmpR family, phosphate regulon sensor histidine kinase PhoR